MKNSVHHGNFIITHYVNALLCNNIKLIPSNVVLSWKICTYSLCIYFNHCPIHCGILISTVPLNFLKFDIVPYQLSHTSHNAWIGMLFIDLSLRGVRKCTTWTMLGWRRGGSGRGRCPGRGRSPTRGWRTSGRRRTASWSRFQVPSWWNYIVIEKKRKKTWFKTVIAI